MHITPRLQPGFTLTELLMVMTIVAILTAITVPTYNHVVQKSRRADAQSALQNLRQSLERHYTIYYTYENTTNGNAPLPSIFPSEAPLEGAAKYYDLEIRAPSTTAYVLAAVPKNAQQDDPCGTLLLNSNGRTDVTEASQRASWCWGG